MLSPRQDSKWHYDRRPAMSSAEGEIDQKMPTGRQDGTRSRRAPPVFRMCQEILRQPFTNNSIRQEDRRPCQVVIRCQRPRMGVIGLVTLLPEWPNSLSSRPARAGNGRRTAVRAAAPTVTRRRGMADSREKFSHSLRLRCNKEYAGTPCDYGSALKE